MLKGELWVKKDKLQASTLLWRTPSAPGGVSFNSWVFGAFSPPVHSSKTNHIKHKSSHVQSLHSIPFSNTSNGGNRWCSNTRIQWASVLKLHMHCGRCILQHRIEGDWPPFELWPAAHDDVVVLGPAGSLTLTLVLYTLCTCHHFYGHFSLFAWVFPRPLQLPGTVQKRAQIGNFKLIVGVSVRVLIGC